jgi:hypothetical protein
MPEPARGNTQGAGAVGAGPNDVAGISSAIRSDCRILTTSSWAVYERTWREKRGEAPARKLSPTAITAIRSTRLEPRGRA